ncbi:MAG: hypothetical protein PUG71_07425 [bacterium]|nr:hypothetical protein [bacterium]
MALRAISKKISEYIFFWALGGCIYYGIEIAFRGFSHWSMFCVGGLVFLFCIIQGVKMEWSEGLWVQIIRGVIYAISLEFTTGIIFNKWLRKNIWDYSDQPLQLWGQICVPFAIIFSGLLLIAILLGGFLSCVIYKEPKPHFFVL